MKVAHSRAAEIASTAMQVNPAVREMATKRGHATLRSVNAQSGASGAHVVQLAAMGNAPDHARVRTKMTKPMTKKIAMYKTARVYILNFFAQLLTVKIYYSSRQLCP